jgi:hypothetical protein
MAAYASAPNAAAALRIAHAHARGGYVARSTEARQRHRAQEAIGADRARLDCPGFDPGQYEHARATLANLPRSPRCLTFEDGPGDAQRRRQRPQTDTIAYSNPTLYNPRPETSLRSSKYDRWESRKLHTKRDRFGRSEPMSSQHYCLHQPDNGVPCPGVYDLPSLFEPAKPALGRGIAIPVSRASGLQGGAVWTAAASARLSRSPRNVVTVVSLETRQKELREKPVLEP